MYVKVTMARTADKKINGAATEKKKVYPHTLILILEEGVLGSDQRSAPKMQTVVPRQKIPEMLRYLHNVSSG